MLSFCDFVDTIIPERKRMDGNYCAEQYGLYMRDEIAVGDGATVCLWSDRNAYTVIKRTAKTLTLQRDRVTRDPEWKPDYIPGGFSVICLNNSEQRWLYESDPEGKVITAHWSQKKLGFYWQGLHVIPGRCEFYDYNF